MRASLTAAGRARRRTADARARRRVAQPRAARRSGLDGARRAPRLSQRTRLSRARRPHRHHRQGDRPHCRGPRVVARAAWPDRAEGRLPRDARDAHRRARSRISGSFRRYVRLCGMSGTLREARGELRDDIRTATSCRCRCGVPAGASRSPTRLFANDAARRRAVAARVAALREAGRPVLIGTDSVERFGSAAARARAPRHSARGAERAPGPRRSRNHRAGGRARARSRSRPTWPGRGTDIRLGAGRGGTRRAARDLLPAQPARRLDRQLQGRCARQGDPGSVETWLALGPGLFPAHRHSPPVTTNALCGCPACSYDAQPRFSRGSKNGVSAAQRRQLVAQDREWERRCTFAPTARLTMRSPMKHKLELVSSASRSAFVIAQVACGTAADRVRDRAGARRGGRLAGDRRDRRASASIAATAVKAGDALVMLRADVERANLNMVETRSRLEADVAAAKANLQLCHAEARARAAAARRRRSSRDRRSTRPRRSTKSRCRSSSRRKSRRESSTASSASRRRRSGCARSAALSAASSSIAT